jgi:acyl-CoA dehydrogenase
VADTTFLRWPFFEDRHRAFASALDAWAAAEIGEDHHDDLDAAGRIGAIDSACRTLVKRLGAGGWLRHAVAPDGARLDVRTLCLARETLGRHSGLADFAFAMQGLGAGPISIFGSDALRERYLPAVAAGKTIAAFALSEPDAGSDVTAMRTTARRDGDAYVVDGTKTWISNAGIAGFYTTFCALDDGGGATGRDRRFIALVVDAGAPGLTVSERIDVSAPHPLGTLLFKGCRVPVANVIGDPTKGLATALGTLDVFRSTVGAAALGFARRAFDEALAHVRTRSAFGEPLADFQLTQDKIARMALEIDASALLIYRAAWTRDSGAPRITREAAMAKLYATEHAQHVIDDSIQLLGARGVVRGATVERLYREIRALRIYEGTSEIQKLVIAGQVLKAESAQP